MLESTCRLCVGWIGESLAEFCVVFVEVCEVKSVSTISSVHPLVTALRSVITEDSDIIICKTKDVSSIEDVESSAV